MFCSVDRADPFCSAAGQHFNQLLRRFGAPVVILNLVKVGLKRTCFTNLCSFGIPLNNALFKISLLPCIAAEIAYTSPYTFLNLSTQEIPIYWY